MHCWRWKRNGACDQPEPLQWRHQGSIQDTTTAGMPWHDINLNPRSCLESEPRGFSAGMGLSQRAGNCIGSAEIETSQLNEWCLQGDTELLFKEMWLLHVIAGRRATNALESSLINKPWMSHDSGLFFLLWCQLQLGVSTSKRQIHESLGTEEGKSWAPHKKNNCLFSYNSIAKSVLLILDHRQHPWHSTFNYL